LKGSIRQRGKKYEVVVSIGRNPITGNRKQKTKSGFTRKRDAEAFLRKWLIELDENRYVEPTKETFESYMEYWFTTHYQKRIKETTVSNRKYAMEKHLIRENPFSNIELSKITTEMIDSLYNKKLDEGYSTNTIRKIHQMLNQAFKQAVKWKKVAHNPVVDADPPAVKTKESKIWSFEEIHSFLAHSKEERHYITFLLAIYTGMRKGEILGIKWSDIDFKNKIIRVERTLVSIPGKGYELSSPKTFKSRRQIHIPDHLLEALIAHKEQQKIWKQCFGIAYQENDLVVCTEKGTFQDPRNVLRVMKRLCETANITKIRFHDIRHTHASILIAERVDIVKVANRLGHTKAKTTLDYYAHLIPSDQDEVADIFHNALMQKKDGM